MTRLVDKPCGRRPGTARTAHEIAAQKASIARSQEKGTWLSGGFKRKL